MSQTRAAIDPDIADEVVAFLRTHPSFLADHPDLYHTLAPPVRWHGEAVADHMAAMIRAERARTAAHAARADDTVRHGRATAGLVARIQAGVLALIATADPLDCAQNELAGVMGLDAVALCFERPTILCRTLATGTVARLLGGREAVYRQMPGETRLLYAEAANLVRVDALVRVPVRSGPALLALGSRHRQGLHRTQGTGALAFLGRTLAAALDRPR